jgi:hypothetical protein
MFHQECWTHPVPRFSLCLSLCLLSPFPVVPLRSSDLLMLAISVSWVLGPHAYNLNYSGGRDQEDHSSQFTDSLENTS